MVPVEGAVQPGISRRSKLLGALRRHWNNRRYGDSKLRSPQVKEFLRKLSKIRERAFRSVRQPCPRPPKILENVSLKGRQTASLPEAPTYIGSSPG